MQKHFVNIEVKLKSLVEEDVVPKEDFDILIIKNCVLSNFRYLFTIYIFGESVKSF